MKQDQNSLVRADLAHCLGYPCEQAFLSLVSREISSLWLLGRKTVLSPVPTPKLYHLFSPGGFFPTLGSTLMYKLTGIQPKTQGSPLYIWNSSSVAPFSLQYCALQTRSWLLNSLPLETPRPFELLPLSQGYSQETALSLGDGSTCLFPPFRSHCLALAIVQCLKTFVVYILYRFLAGEGNPVPGRPFWLERKSHCSNLHVLNANEVKHLFIHIIHS